MGVEVAPTNRLAIYERDRWVCYLCELPVARYADGRSPWAPSLDHVVPLVAGGPHCDENLRLAHLRCNLVKGSSVVVQPPAFYRRRLALAA